MVSKPVKTRHVTGRADTTCVTIDTQTGGSTAVRDAEEAQNQAGLDIISRASDTALEGK